MINSPNKRNSLCLHQSNKLTTVLFACRHLTQKSNQQDSAHFSLAGINFTQTHASTTICFTLLNPRSRRMLNLHHLSPALTARLTLNLLMRICLPQTWLTQWKISFIEASWLICTLDTLYKSIIKSAIKALVYINLILILLTWVPTAFAPVLNEYRQKDSQQRQYQF